MSDRPQRGYKLDPPPPRHDEERGVAAHASSRSRQGHSQPRHQEPRRERNESARSNNRNSRRRGGQRRQSNSRRGQERRRKQREAQVELLEHLVTGETPLRSEAPSADAPQSDAATVNSSSNVEDFDDLHSKGSSSTRGALQNLNSSGDRDSSTRVHDQAKAKDETSTSTKSEDKKPKARPSGSFHPLNQDQHSGDANSASREGHAIGDEDDGNQGSTSGVSSLEVELHSTDTNHSLPSSGDLTPDESKDSERIEEDADFSESIPAGRQSPGGTVYIGQGTRRYQGRYANLTLRRFHNEGVDPESLQNESSGHVYDPRQASRRRESRRSRSDLPAEAVNRRRTQRRERSRSRDRSDFE